MKSFGLLLIVFSFCFVSLVSGQSKSKKSLQQAKSCKTNNISFPCPKDFQIKTEAKNTFVAFNSTDKIGLYAFSPSETLSEQDLISETLKNALQTIYLTDYKDYEWKDSDDFFNDSQYSEYESAKIAKAGFNKGKQQTIHLHLIRLSFKQKDLLVGFVYELSKGKTAQEMFNSWRGGGNGDASDNLQNLIAKITGEKKTEETPGGPPPAKQN